MKDPKEETTYGLSPDRLARLLAIGLEGKEDQDDLGESSAAAEVLQEMLSSKLPGDEALVADRTIGSVLLNPKSDLVAIQTLKEYGKELAHRGGPEATKAAATVIYYAAIAKALLVGHKKITRHPYEKLHAAFVDLEQEPWMPPEMKKLFQRAQALCQQRKEKPK